MPMSPPRTSRICASGSDMRSRPKKRTWPRVIRPGGHATFNVAIRTVSVDAARGVAECGIGSGITIGSRAIDEYEEWQVKEQFLLRASA